MLNGVGGKTISEAINNLSFAELTFWRQYRAKRGSFNVGLRVEFAAALLAYLYCTSHSKTPYKMHEFAPHMDEPPVTLDEAMKTWR